MGFVLRTTDTRFLSAVAFPDRHFPSDFKFWWFQILWFGWFNVVSWFGAAAIGGRVVVCATGCGVRRDRLWFFVVGFPFTLLRALIPAWLILLRRVFVDRRKVHGGWPKVVRAVVVGCLLQTAFGFVQVLHGGFMFVLLVVFCSSVVVCLLPEAVVLVGIRLCFCCFVWTGIGRI